MYTRACYVCTIYKGVKLIFELKGILMALSKETKNPGRETIKGSFEQYGKYIKRRIRIYLDSE